MRYIEPCNCGAKSLAECLNSLCPQAPPFKDPEEVEIHTVMDFPTLESIRGRLELTRNFSYPRIHVVTDVIAKLRHRAEVARMARKLCIERQKALTSMEVCYTKAEIYCSSLEAELLEEISFFEHLAAVYAEWSAEKAKPQDEKGS